MLKEIRYGLWLIAAVICCYSLPAQTPGASNNTTVRLVPLTLMTVAMVMPPPTLRLTPVFQLLPTPSQGQGGSVLSDQRASRQAERPVDGFQEPRSTQEGRRGGPGQD